MSCRKARNGSLLLWPFLRAAHSGRPPLASPLRLSGGGLGSRTGQRVQLQSQRVSFRCSLCHRRSPFSPRGRRQHLESKSVLLCSEVCVVLVPLAWGQALFSVDVLRGYPNVQDLGVGARLSESAGGGRREEIRLTFCS